MARVKSRQAEEDPEHAARLETLARLREIHTDLSPDQLVDLRYAFPVLYKQHEPWVSQRLAARGLQGAAADDAFQETFIALFKSLMHGFPRCMDRLLHVITKRRVASHVRALLNAKDFVEIPSSRSEPPGSDPDFEGALDRVEVPQRLLRRLRPAHREVIQKVWVEGLSLDEAALQLGIPVGTVKTRLTAAEASLKALAREPPPRGGGES